MTKIKKYVPWCIIFLLVVLVSILILKCCQKAENGVKTVYIHDTITMVEWDTLYLDHYKTVKLPVHDTTLFFLTDTLTLVDSVEVEIPIYHYAVDTTFTTDTTTFNLGIRCSGYDVSLDTLAYDFIYTPTPQKKKTRIGFFVGPCLGVGWTGGKQISPSIGIGVGIGFDFRK